MYEGALFHRRQPMPGKTVDCFVSMLHIPVDECDFGDCPTWGAISPLVFETRNIPKSFQIDGKLTVNSPSKSTIEVNDTDPTAWKVKKCGDVGVGAAVYRRRQQDNVPQNQGSARPEKHCNFHGR